MIAQISSIAAVRARDRGVVCFIASMAKRRSFGQVFRGEDRAPGHPQTGLRPILFTALRRWGLLKGTGEAGAGSVLSGKVFREATFSHCPWRQVAFAPAPRAGALASGRKADTRYARCFS
ncbi:hypothetical protein [Pseudoxanthobacter sp.]|uniref:hypothetical protein n=1 Tax=Pseudoxanthobacter sp. TaxID=1925742 RepID=UPI002FE0BB09